jgi:hypothetical protein
MTNPIRLWLLTPAMLCGLTLSLPGQADSAMPSANALAKWDKNFQPGYYDVTETPLDKNGQPIDKDSRNKKQCLTERDAKAMARAPLNQESPKECRTEVELSPPILTVTAHCLVNGEKTIVVSSAGVSNNAKEYDLATLKMRMPDNGEPQMVYGTGTHMKYLGTCP